MSFASLVWKEIRQRPTAMLTGLITITLGVAALVAVRNISFFSEQAVARELEALGANVLVLPQGVTLQDYYSADLHGQTMPEEFVQQLAFSNLEGVQNLSPKLCVPARINDRSVILTGILPQSEFQTKSAWQATRLFTKHKGCKRACSTGDAGPDSLARHRTVEELRENETLLGADIAAATGLKAGSTVELFGEKLTVSALLPTTGTVDDGRVFAHLHTVQQMARLGEVVNVIEIMGCCEDVASGLVKQLGELLPGTKVVTIAQVVQTQVSINRMMQNLSCLFLVILVGMAGASIANATVSNIRERRREIGTLVAIGATPGFISRMFLARSCLFGFVGGVVGYITGTALAVSLGPQWAGVAVEPLPMLGLIAVTGSTLVGMAAAWWPAASAAGLDPSYCFKEI